MNETRKNAAKAGEMFFQSKACRTCGKMPRYVSTGKCVACVQEKSRAHYDETMAQIRAARATA